MRTDEKVELGQKIAGQLEKVNRSEWSRWCSYATKHGLEKAIKFAQVMEGSVSLRKGPKESYKKICQMLNSSGEELKKLQPDELAEVLGYAGQAIVAKDPRGRD
jgi:hypothetical protein